MASVIKMQMCEYSQSPVSVGLASIGNKPLVTNHLLFLFVEGYKVLTLELPT